ncbi:MAG: GIY-YIG nuclease family protein [Candidatus Pacebacteria bacterium]|jgi:putative endonuclease|nr:GIY-YIG nuclease family protein [Candidatus Paceibacterota bacterium]
MHYCYILYSLKSGIFYIDHTGDLEREVVLHNRAKIVSTGPHLPWELVWHESFDTEKKAHDCARYLKSHNGREYVYKRLLSMIFPQNKVMES